jgi:hypothetical protein
MIPHRFNIKLAILALVGIILFLGSAQLASNEKNDSMQPELSSPLVSKKQAMAAAAQFLQKSHPSLIITESMVIYDSKKLLSAYLQKNKLTKPYKAEYSKTFPLDFWRVQLWDQLAAARYTVDIGMAQPNVIGWNIEGNIMLTNGEQANKSTEAKAREITENFIAKKGFDLSSFEKKPVALKNRSSLFEYVQTKSTIGDAKQKLSVEISDNEVSAYHVDFIIPEADSTWITKQENYGQIMSLISLAGMVVFSITALVISIRKRKLISFSRGWLITGLFLMISVAGTLNNLPSAGIELAQKNATIYLTIYLIFTIGINFLLAVAVYFMLITGVQMWKERGWNVWPRWKETKFANEVFYGMGRGYLICIFIIGMQQALFLFTGKIFHSFAINDPSQSEYNMLWPILFPTMAWMAAISEEIIFRLFGIIIFQKLLRFRFLAILIPSIIWALGHTSYSLYPSYTRLFEVTVLGIIFSYTFLRYGLITAIFTHAIMDSLLMGLSLMYSTENTSYTIMGLFYIILPALIAYFIRFMKRKSIALIAAA